MDTNSPEYRKACEVRWLLTQTREQRTAYYSLVEKARGPEAAKALVADVMEEYRRRQGALF